ncbi:hypothetical protein ACH5RR_008026 [Cinchona calisaya]|uniref:Uncharacterized protein n=1 Tax=Cinchona calisaya TaxID=153742 RepID=A0ABD3AAF4_9GENT
MRAYEPVIPPADGPNGWPHVDGPTLFPPKKIKLTERPRKAKIREPDEVRNVTIGATRLSRKGITEMTCTHCKLTGHNIRTCPSNLTQNVIVGNQTTKGAENLTNNNAVNQMDENQGDGNHGNLNKCGRCQKLEYNRRSLRRIIRFWTQSRAGLHSSLFEI